jgi:ubiquinol-cytochrome c reductase cytochrome b subunit
MRRWFDERLGLSGIARSALHKVFPDHWTFLLGEVALFCFLVLLLTGVFLTLFYVPDATSVTYAGPYDPLKGREMSAAYASTLNLSFAVQAGLVVRQMHHWAALVFLAAISVHLMRIFFTGAYRKPREINWLVGIGLLTLALAMGVTGYSLPDDLLSGTGLRIIYTVVLSIPFLGPYLAFLLFGGEFPTAAIISRLFVFHVMLLPAILIGGIVVHLAILVRQKHTQWPGLGRTEHNVVGRAFWPSQALRSTGLALLTAAVLALMGGLIQINPIWIYGPFNATQVSAPAQPDWYVGWLEGAIRLFPSFEITLLGITIPAVFLPAIVIPGLAFAAMALWPFIEAAVTADHERHQLLQRPRDAPLRTAIGVAGLTFFVLLTVAGGNDVIAAIFSIQVEVVTVVFRVLVLAGPVLAGVATYLACAELRRREQSGEAEPATVHLRRNPAGGVDEITDAEPATGSSPRPPAPPA